MLLQEWDFITTEIIDLCIVWIDRIGKIYCSTLINWPFHSALLDVSVYIHCLSEWMEKSYYRLEYEAASFCAWWLDWCHNIICMIGTSSPPPLSHGDSFRHRHAALILTSSRVRILPEGWQEKHSEKLERKIQTFTFSHSGHTEYLGTFYRAWLTLEYSFGLMHLLA